MSWDENKYKAEERRHSLREAGWSILCIVAILVVFELATYIQVGGQ